MMGSAASGYAREADDWYVEPSWVVAKLFAVEPFEGLIYDPACGGGTIPKAATAAGYEAYGSDRVDRGYGIAPRDFMTFNHRVPNIVSNPPYGDQLFPFVQKALAVTTRKVAIIARLSFLESVERASWWPQTPLRRVWVSARRVSMPPGRKPEIKAKGGSVAYAWFVWEHGYTGKGEVEILV